MTDGVEFNGVEISDFFQVIDVQRPVSGRTNQTMQVSGRDGLAHVGSAMNPVMIAVTVIIPDMTISERRERIRELSAILHTDEERPLKFRSDNGLYYKAVLDGEVPVTEHVRTDRVTFNFAAESPMLYGETKSVTIPSQGQATVYVDGTYGAWPRFEGSLTGNGDGLWGVRIDEGDALRVDVGTTATPVSVDCDERVVVVNGETSMIELESDWIRLPYGEHVLRNDVGSGACTVTWTERWY
jgi:predicted phage tail component-like protein